MSKLTILLFTAVLTLGLPWAAHAKILNLKDAPFSAIGDGVTDDRPALVRAFSEAQSGDTVLIPPGTYQMILTGGPLAIPDGVTLWGQTESRGCSSARMERAANIANFCDPKAMSRWKE